MSIIARSKFRTAGITVAALLTLGLALPAAASATAVSETHPHPTQAKPTVVLVHGAWADASSFAPVTKRLQNDGYTVLNAPNPLRGIANDAASVAAFVDQATTGPVVLVGHSYAGMVITAAATSLPRVTDLVYVNAFAPETGESVGGLAEGSESVLAAQPGTVFDFVNTTITTEGVPATTTDLYVKRNLFHSFFAAQMNAKDAAVLSAEQAPIAGPALQEKLQGVPAWKRISSWFVIGTNDKVIPKADQLKMAQRANGRITTVNADHLSMLQQPAQITRVIENAAQTK